MIRYFPMAVNLQQQPVLVIGGGDVAERKVFSLYETGAKVRLISPMVTSALQQLANENKVEWIQREVQQHDITDICLVISATNDRVINQNVARWAQSESIWVNVVDNPQLSNFISPAVFRADNAILAIYTNGEDPVLSRDLKNFLEERWHDFISYRDKL